MSGFDHGTWAGYSSACFAKRGVHREPTHHSHWPPTLAAVRRGGLAPPGGGDAGGNRLRQLHRPGRQRRRREALPAEQLSGAMQQSNRPLRRPQQRRRLLQPGRRVSSPGQAARTAALAGSGRATLQPVPDPRPRPPRRLPRPGRAAGGREPQQRRLPPHGELGRPAAHLRRPPYRAGPPQLRVRQQQGGRREPDHALAIDPDNARTWAALGKVREDAGDRRRP